MMNLKKTLALLLAVVMVIGLIPFGAMADETTPTETTAPIETTAPVETDPVETDPVETDPIETDPIETDPTNPVTPQSDDPTNPVVTEPVVTEPVVTEPVVTEPTVTEPVVTEPVVTEPVVTEPVVTEPVVTEPVVTDPTDPTETEPVVTDPTDPTETEPVETEPTVTEPEIIAEEVEALYNALMACDSVEDLDPLLADMTEDEYNTFLAELPAELSEKLNAHMRELFSADSSEIVIPEPAVNYSYAAPFGDPVEGKPVMRLMRMLSSRAAGDGDSTATDNGLELRKNVSGTEKDGYTLTLEAWATGAKTITSSTTSVPTDIVLVLDQSGSMEYCMYSECERENCNGDHGYTVTYDVSTDGEYYIRIRESYWDDYQYLSLHYCSECEAWFTVTQHAAHSTDNDYHPRTSATDRDNDSFYEHKTYAIRINALKEALGIFTNNVATKAKGADGVLGTEDDVDHTVSVVGFASGRSYDGQNYNYGNTELFVGNTAYTYNAGSSNNAENANAAQQHYEDAPQDMSTPNGVANVTASINALTASGGTIINLGMEMANGILKANSVPPGEKRNRVVIVFTDGTPGWSGYDSDVASDAIEQAGITKVTHNATVYTVGIFAGADATSDGSSTGNDTQKANYFMQRLSSNTSYPQSPSYYLSASDSTTLNNIFETISDNIESGGSTTTLTESAVIKDVITDQFELPAGADADDIKVYTAEVSTIDSTTTPTAYTWKNRVEFTDADVSISTDRKTVSVDNFNYSENWVGTETKDNVVTPRGKKLIIEIPIVVREGFLGGNGVLTNGAGSGLYESGTANTPMEEFVSPTVDVEVATVTVTAPNCSVYLLGDVAADALKNGLIVKVKPVKGDEITLNMDAENYGLAAWQNAYVTINDPTAQGALSDLINDTTYSATVTISHDPEGTVIATSGTGTGNVYVFKPRVTFKDSEVFYGDQIPAFAENNYDGIEWVNENAPEGQTPTGEAPEVVLGYDKTENAVMGKTDVKVNVATAMIGETDIMQHLTFAHTDCSDDCSFNSATEEFIVHPIMGKLTVTKVGGEAGEPYKITVYKDGDAYTELTLVGNTSVTICELPKGIYSISEDMDWAWRYDEANVSYSESVTINSTNPNGNITCTNSGRNNSWLNDFSDVIANISGVPKGND